MSDQQQVTEYVAALLRRACESHAGGLQLDPTEDGVGTVRMCVDGVLRGVDPPSPKGTFPAVIDHLKTLGAMNVEERRVPQDGRCADNEYAFLLSTAPVYWGERAAIRILPRQADHLVMGLDNLGMDNADLAKVRRLSQLPQGLIIVNGPTDCGKTTLLYSILIELIRPEVNILTIEDPVELAIPGVSQMALRPDVGLTFPRAIISMLRSAVNVMMVGEIRDLETAELCHQAALTGHLVLTTLHANTSPHAVCRLMDLGVRPFVLAGALAGVISLRLVRVLCPNCRKEAKPDLKVLPPRVRQFMEANPDARFFAPDGCDKCNGTGYSGRTGIFEVMTCDDQVRQAISDKAPLTVLRQTASAGMRTMMQDGLEKAARGITSLQELLRLVPAEEWE